MDRQRLQLKILLIEDNPDDVTYVRELLGQESLSVFNIEQVPHLSEGMARLFTNGFDVVLLDLSLPDSRRADTMDKIPAVARHRPVIVLTGNDDEETGIQAVHEGAQDYVYKGRLDKSRLSHSILYAVERHQILEALRESEERYRDLFENANDLIFFLSADGRFCFMNQVWHSTLGYTEEDLEKMSAIDMVHPEDRVRWMEIQERAAAGKAVEKFELTLMSKDGRPVRLEGGVNCFFKKSNPVAYRYIFRDVTGHRQTVEHRDKFLRSVLGELQYPQTLLQTALERLRTGAQGPGETGWMEEISLACRNSAQMGRIVRAALELSGLESGQSRMARRALKLGPLLRAGAERVQRECRRHNIHIDVLVPDGLPEVYADAEMIAQVLTHLLANAIRFAREKIAVVASAAQHGGAHGTHDAEVGNEVQISVIDDGPGIPEDRMGSLFNKFAQLENSPGWEDHQGSRLGLAICREIVKIHGGKIWAESVHGRGTAFHFRLPRFEERDHFLSTCQQAIYRAKCDNMPLSVLALSISNLDTIKIQADEAQIEKMYRDLEERIGSVIRTSDVLRRFRGHLIVLAGAGRPDCLLIRNRILSRVAGCFCAVRGVRIPLECRMGFATHNQDSPPDPNALVEIALTSTQI